MDKCDGRLADDMTDEMVDWIMTAKMPGGVAPSANDEHSEVENHHAILMGKLTSFLLLFVITRGHIHVSLVEEDFC